MKCRERDNISEGHIYSYVLTFFLDICITVSFVGEY